MSMANINWNAMPIKASTTLMVHVLIDGKEILPQALYHEEVAKGCLWAGQMWNLRVCKFSMRPPS